MEEEQRGIASHAVLGADFVVLRAVHLDCYHTHTHTKKNSIDSVAANIEREQICLLRVLVEQVNGRAVM